MSEELKPCPCGEVPKDLHIQPGDYKWAWVAGDCCGEWSIDFRTMYFPYRSNECKRLAKEAWNNAHRRNPTADKLAECLERIIKSTPHSMCHDARAWVESEQAINEYRRECGHD